MRCLVFIFSLMPFLADATETWYDSIIIPKADIDDVLTADMTDLECLAYNIYHESRGEGYFGMQIVAQVTMSRVESGHFKDSACEVVRRQDPVTQFSWTKDGASDRADSEPDKWAESYLMAIDFLYNGTRLTIKGVDVSKLLFYHATHVTPFSNNVKEVFRHGNHVVYETTLPRI